MLAAFAEHS